MTVSVSENGWPLRPPRSARPIMSDRSSIKLTVVNGPAGDLLLHYMGQIDLRVEDLDLKSTRGEYDDWSYAERLIRDGVKPSNHFSATAADGNATRHPLGKVNTFTPGQRDEIRRIGREHEGLIRWGGDYTGRKDEMHHELAPGSTHAKCAVVLAKLLRQPLPGPVAANPGATLMKGSQGSEVARLQKLLNAKYPLYSKLPVTGLFGDMTVAVVQEFQRRSKLVADGIVGPVTRRAMGF